MISQQNVRELPKTTRKKTKKRVKKQRKNEANDRIIARVVRLANPQNSINQWEKHVIHLSHESVCAPSRRI